MKIPQTFRHATKDRNPPAPLPKKKLPGSIKLASKTSGVSSPESKKAKSESNSTCKLWLFHKTKSHPLNECKKFRELTWEENWDFFKKNKICFKCMTPSKHNAEHCDQTPPVCDICHKRHLTALHTDTTPDHKEQPNAPGAKNTSIACTQEETSSSRARIVHVQASHQSNLAKKTNTVCSPWRPIHRCLYLRLLARRNGSRRAKSRLTA